MRGVARSGAPASTGASAGSSAGSSKPSSPAAFLAAARPATIRPRRPRRGNARGGMAVDAVIETIAGWDTRRAGRRGGEDRNALSGVGVGSRVDSSQAAWTGLVQCTGEPLGGLDFVRADHELGANLRASDADRADRLTFASKSSLDMRLSARTDSLSVRPSLCAFFAALATSARSARPCALWTHCRSRGSS